MNKQIKSMDQLKDSRLLYEKKVPRFGYIILIVITLLLIGVVIWSLYTPKVYMIKTTGMVTNENAGYVMPAYTGEIVTVLAAFLKQLVQLITLACVSNFSKISLQKIKEFTSKKRVVV